MFDFKEKGPKVRGVVDPVPGRIVRLKGNKFDHWDYRITGWDSARGDGFPTREYAVSSRAPSDARPGFKVFKPDWEKINREYEEKVWKLKVEASEGRNLLLSNRLVAKA